MFKRALTKFESNLNTIKSKAHIVMARANFELERQRRMAKVVVDKKKLKQGWRPP